MKIWTTKLFLLLAFFVFTFEVNAQRDRAIAEVQGDGHMSPFQGNAVRLEGIVTARTRSGFFIQTPDAKIDNNPNTSEGIFVYTRTEPTVEATIGNLVSVTGLVLEFRPKTAPNSLSITQLSMRRNVDSIKVISSGNDLPKAIVLSEADFAPNDFGQLEKYEGMRVAVESLTVVAPTRGRFDLRNGKSVSDGVFFGVLKGKPRAFREPGMDIREFMALTVKNRDEIRKNHPKMGLFDTNPEVIRIHSSEQLGARTINVTANAEVKNLSGVMSFSFNRYAILTDVNDNIEVSGLIKSAPLPELKENQFSFAAMNLENFFDDEDDPAIKEDILTPEAFKARKSKVSLAVRDYLRFPDVIGVTEAENLSSLKRLADRINADAVAAKQPNPKYEAYLLEGNDGRGIDVGYLVKSARVTVNKVAQLGKDETFSLPGDKREMILNDRPPLLLEGTIKNPNSDKPLAFAAIVNHKKSFLGYSDPKDGGFRVRTKKKLQAEFLARAVQERQKANPDENIVVLGDLNFYQFNDGITDIIGTIKGTPAGKDEVLMPSEDLVDPDLINLVDLIQANQRYSYTFDGNAQVLDHILINQTMRKYLIGFGYARVNVDFPEIYRNDLNRVERFSDHDVAVAYFTFDEKK